MEISIYNSDLNPLGVIDRITSFIWTRRYWSCGEFKLLLPFTPYHANLVKVGRLVVRKDDDELGEIKYISIRKNQFGMEEIEVQGKFLTSWLNKRILLNQIISNDNSQNILCQIVRENCTQAGNRLIPNLEIAGDTDVGSGNISYASEPFVSVLLACESVAKAAKLGFKITTDIIAGKHAFHVYKGKDLTSEQTENPPCVFSQEFDNILEQEFNQSTENLRTVAYVGGEEKEDTQRVVVEVGESLGLDRNEVFINASDIERGTILLSEYTELLLQRGGGELSRYVESLNFSSRINPYINLRYKQDFDVGDRVTCIDKRWGVKINVRIAEVAETYQKDAMKIDVVFGESLPTLTDKLSKRN